MTGKPMVDPNATKTVEYLKAYLEDIKYQFKSSGIDYVNYNSSGTQFFESEVECASYIDKLEKLINRIKYVKEV